MKALLRLLGLAGPPPELHRKWLDALCRPPEASRMDAVGPTGLASDGPEPPPARGRSAAGVAPSGSTRFLLGPPKH